MFDDDTIDDAFGADEELITVPDHRALTSELDDDTVVTSAAPEPDESPWPEQLARGVVCFASGSIG